MKKIQHFTVEVESECIEAIICDRCKKEYSTDNFVETQEFHHIKFIAGYGSVFGDMNSVEADICQHCLKELIGDFCRVG